MFYFNKIPPNQFALLGALLGVLLNFSLDSNEQNSFGNFLVSIGQTLMTSAAQAVNKEAHPTKSFMLAQINQMSAQLDELKNQLKQC